MGRSLLDAHVAPRTLRLQAPSDLCGAASEAAGEDPPPRARMALAPARDQRPAVSAAGLWAGYPRTVAPSRGTAPARAPPAPGRTHEFPRGVPHCWLPDVRGRSRCLCRTPPPGRELPALA